MRLVSGGIFSVISGAGNTKVSPLGCSVTHGTPPLFTWVFSNLQTRGIIDLTVPGRIGISGDDRNASRLQPIDSDYSSMHLCFTVQLAEIYE